MHWRLAPPVAMTDADRVAVDGLLVYHGFSRADRDWMIATCPSWEWAMYLYPIEKGPWPMRRTGQPWPGGMRVDVRARYAAHAATCTIADCRNCEAHRSVVA